MKYLFSTLLFTLLLSCSHAPPTQYYRFEDWSKSDSVNRIPETLVVKPFSASPVLRQNKMIFASTPFQINYDYYHRWILPPDIMLTQQTVDFFRTIKLFDNVSAETVSFDTAASILTLHAHIQHFEEQIKEGKRNAKVAVYFELTGHEHSSPLWNGTIEKTSFIQGVAPEDVVQAMQTAYRQVMQELVDNMIDVNP